MENATDYSGNYTFLFNENAKDLGACYHCVRFYTRTVNILEKIESQ
jgi:hypothetical protein